MNAKRCVSMKKGCQHYVFWYHEGQEAELLNALVTLASDDECEFDWFDAAVLSYRMGRTFEPDLETVR